MPIDSKGKFHNSTQRMIAAEGKAPSKPMPKPMHKPMPEPMMDDPDGGITQKVMEEAEAAGADPDDLEQLQQLLGRIFGGAESYEL